MLVSIERDQIAGPVIMSHSLGSKSLQKSISVSVLIMVFEPTIYVSRINRIFRSLETKHECLGYGKGLNGLKLNT